MNEPADGQNSMEGPVAETIGLLAPGDAPAVPSSFKVRGHDCVTTGHDVGGGEKQPAAHGSNWGSEVTKT